VKILVIGASRARAALAVKSGLDRGHRSVAFAARRRALARAPKLTKVAETSTRRRSVRAAVRRRDAVVVTAFTSSIAAFKKDPASFSRAPRS